MSLPTAPTFTTLPALRRAHTALLRRRQSSSDAPSPAELLEFMRQAQASGRRIANDDARDAAQTIIDYWYGALVREARNESSLLPPSSVTLDAYEGSTEAADSEPESKARYSEDLKASVSKFENTTFNKNALRLLLLKLFKLNPATGKPERVQCPVKDLGTTPDEEALAKRMTEGTPSLLQLEPAAGSSEPNAYVLQNDSLFEDWPRLASVVDERRSLRALSTGWLKSGESPSALLEKGDFLENSTDYPDLSGDEQRFLRASREAANARDKAEALRNSKERRNLWIGVGVLAAMLFFSWSQAGKLADSNNELKRTIVIKDEFSSREKKARDELDAQRKIFENTATQEMQELKRTRDQLKEELHILSDTLKAQGLASLPETTVKIVETYASKDEQKDGKPKLVDRTPLKTDVVSSLTSSRKQFSPGGSITTSDVKGMRGSLSFYVRDLQNPDSIYIVGPKYLLSDKEGTEILAGTQTLQTIAKVSNRVNLQKAQSLDLVLAKLEDSKFADNTFFGQGLIVDVFDPAKLTPDTRVALVGSGSGYSEGKFKRIDPDGNIVTTRISKPGDAGAPVVVPDPNDKDHIRCSLLGVLLARSGSSMDESIVRPASPFLKQNGLQLYQPEEKDDGHGNKQPAPPNLFEGALAEIFVSDRTPDYVTQAAGFVTALQKAGITFPKPEAQPKPRVADPSEVRYFYSDDKTIAEAVLKQLKATGIKDDKAHTEFINDPTAPRKFIQVSLSVYAVPGVTPPPAPAPSPAPATPAPAPPPNR